METLIAFVLMALVIALIVALVRRMKSTSLVVAAEDLAVGGRAIDVEPAVVRALAAVPGAGYLAVAPGFHAVTTRRTPWWMVFPAFATFPIGLVLLFLVRETLRLDCVLFDGPDGAVLRLSGQCEQRVLEGVRNAIGGVVNAPAGA